MAGDANGRALDTSEVHQDRREAADQRGWAVHPTPTSPSSGHIHTAEAEDGFDHAFGDVAAP